MTKDEALKMAIDCLEYHYKHGAWGMDIEGVIVSCQEALEQPQKQWVGLSDDDFNDASWFTDEFIEGANWAQNKLKELNT